jgi:hypothetical protein
MRTSTKLLVSAAIVLGTSLGGGAAADAKAKPKPKPPAPKCHPSYSPCVPIASDVDCLGGGGNGPAYV